MPRMPTTLLDSVCYLYKSEEEASLGKNFGGTGFFIFYKIGEKDSFYAVTNSHVACTGGNSVIRINKKNGGVDVISHDPSDWHCIPKYDIAIVPIEFSYIHKCTYIPHECFVTEKVLQDTKIDCGENVVMVGRFIDHDGGVTNKPAARFGNISIMPSPIEIYKRKTDMYCLDMRSRTGYSGSPVFVYRTPGDDLESNVFDMNDKFFKLLGIHVSQFPEKMEIIDSDNPVESHNQSLIMTGKSIQGLSGMTCILPAWNIIDVIIGKQ